MAERGPARARRLTLWRGIAIAAPIVAVVAVLLVILTIGLAGRSMQRGVTEVHAAEASLTSQRVERDPRAAFASAQLHLAAAHADFAGAVRRLGPIEPLLGALGWIPRAGPLAAALPPAAGAGENATAGALHLLNGLEPSITVLTRHHSRASSRVAALVRQLAAGRPQFAQACADLRQAKASAGAIDAASVPALASSLRSFNRQVPRLLTACRVLTVLPPLLGARTPQTYLVAYQNPSELRATGGYIGSVGLLTVRDGQVVQRFHGTDLPRNWAPGTLVPSPDPVALYNNEPYWLLMDSNWSPDFPTSARLERYFTRLVLHRTVSGAIDVTPQASADILAAIGPIYSREFHEWITAGNVARLADYYAHWSPYHGPLRETSLDSQRKQFIGIVSNHILRRVQTLSPSGMLALGGAIATATLQRDLLIWVDEPSAERAIRSAGASGAINRTSSDYLYVVDTNISYDKLNPFIHTSLAYAVRIRPDRWLDVRLDIRFTNVPAPESYRQQGLGPGGGTLGGWDDYASFVRIYVPAGAELVDQSGWVQPWSPGPAYGKTMFSGYLLVPRGQTRIVHLHYVTPPNVFTWSAGRRYRILVQRQPGKELDAFSVSVTHDGRRWSRRVEHPLTDWSRSIPIEARAFHPIPLPAEPPTVVAPNHSIEPHAYLGTPH